MTVDNRQTDGRFPAVPGVKPAPPLPIDDFCDYKLPENLPTDPVVGYLRARYDQRDEFFNQQNENTQRKILDEEKRIAELKRIFLSESTNKQIVDKLADLKTAWKTSAKEECGANKIYVMKEFGKDLPATEDRDKIVERRRKNKLEVLSRVEAADWDKPPVESNANIHAVTGQPGYGFRMSKITLERGPSRNPPFQNYKLERFSIDEATKANSARNPWKKDSVSTSDAIRYFHFPANDMQWIEDAIKRYGEHAESVSEKLLARELWTGQQHGTLNDPIHARHLRPHCTLIPSDTNTLPGDSGSNQPSDSARNNRKLVLFMPYLHWELDSRREKMGRLANDLTYERRKEEFRDQMTQIRHKEIHPDVINLLKQYRSKARLLKMSRAHYTTKSAHRPHKPMKTSNACGQYLLQAARIFEGMELEPDLLLVKHYLHPKSQPDLPFHPRRTLDQSYYPRLERTETRDADQVVYRGTVPQMKINRYTRVIMVDQLWLYILDDKTVLTSFPKRMGRNKPDSSGVHRCIRNRLENLQNSHNGKIKSVYDLALIIMDECSRVFFDRTRPMDERPEVLDIFSAAIGNVSEMKTIAFERFWKCLDRLNGVSTKKINTGVERTYLNINPEGVLLREAQDIIEELRMMEQIYDQQLKVAGDLSKSLEKLNGQFEPQQETIHVLHSILGVLKKANSPTSSYEHQDSPAIPSTADVVPANTIHNCFDFVEKVSSRRQELQQLEASAREVAEQLRDLLTLKQQQASITEAVAALNRAEESVKQGRTIMVFTVITIIFLPLSFMSSIFGMNAQELAGPSGGIMSLKAQFRLMFPISVSLTGFFLIVAFAPQLRNLLRQMRLPNPMHFIISFFRVARMGYKNKEPKLPEKVLEDMDKSKPPRQQLSFQQQKLLEKVYAKTHEYSRESKKHRNNPGGENRNHVRSAIPGTPAGSTVEREEFYNGKKNSSRGGSCAGENAV